MDVEDLIKDTFAAHEQDAPDGAAVFAGARRRIDRGRGMPGRPLLAAAGVVLLALGAVAVVVLNRPGDTAQVGVATGGPAGAPAAQTVPAVRMPFSLGWLPAGKVDYIARRINTGASAAKPQVPVYDGEYLLDVTAGHQALVVDVQEMRMAPIDDAGFKSGPGRPVTIAGRPGVESAHSDGPGGYELYLTHPSGGSVYVNVAPEPGSTAATQQLIDDGRRIAAHLSFPGSTTITPTFGFAALPNGLRTCTFDVERGGTSAAHPRTGYTLGTCTTMDSVQVDTTEPGMVRGQAGTPVQGHQTRYLDERSYRTLWVLDAVHGAPIAIAGHVSQAELYAIANHLVLPR